ncbi:uncharacterized protein cp110 isoform X2 [Genypterus blacodes]|uniref:uncharacterized protein cp110 isoform X2 n=1 Tax=Genypterus blacodes TaxID=154954 RepID=UPI003F75A966
MEDYEEFMQRRLSGLTKIEDEDDIASTPTSLIRFYGKPILPPLLSRQRREEMQRHKTEATNAGERRLLKAESRMAYVQTILQTVQLRKTPTLEELFQESNFNADCPFGSVSQSDVVTGTKDNGMFSLPSDISNGKDGVCFPPLTSTTYSSFFTNHVTPQSEYQDGCLIDCEVKQGSHPETSYLNGANHYSLFSECGPYENVENSAIVHGRVETADDGCSSLDEANSTIGFFLHNTSNTIAKMPNIISHSPVDGEELEKSGTDLSFCKNVIAVHPVEDVCYTSSQHESVECSQSPVGTSEECDSPALTAQLCKDQIEDTNEGSVSVLLSTDLLENSGFSQTLTTDHCSTEEDNQEGKADLNASAEPYKVSLQSLLKKSREYVRYQRMLKNQAKNAKFQEGTQEKPREDEQSLSDKENDGVPCKGTVPSEEKKTRERSGTFSLETSPKSFENEEIILREGIVKEDNKMKENLTPKSTNLTVDNDNDAMVMTRVEGQSDPQNNVSQEVIMEPKERADFPKQPFGLTSEQDTTCPTSVSPVPCKSQGAIKDGDVADGAEIPNRKSLINARLNVNDMVEVEGVTRVLARSSLHIDQLESNLSSLKELISALAENSDNHSQTQDNQQIDLRSKGIKHCDQFKKAQYGQNERAIRVDSNYTEQDQQERIQSNNHKNMHRETGPEPSIINSIPVIVQESHIGEGHGKDTNTSTTEPEKEKRPSNGGQSKTCGQQQPKCSLSQTQRMRVRDVFRTFPSETTVPCESSTLSDTSDQPVDRSGEGTVEEKDSTHSHSLNQSYDVDAPSGLWHLEGPEGNWGSNGHGVKEKGLTPEGLSEGQGGTSKVKRRLLMHVTDDAKEKGGDTRAGSVIRPNSSTPRAAVRWSEGHGGLKDKQQQMKLAHAAQVRALQDQHRRQQEELLQLSGSLSECYRPLVSAVVQGFLTRRLMRTEKVAQLRRTIKDTNQFLQAFQQQSPDKELGIRQDLLLKDRVTLQLRAAHYEVYDIFFSQSAGERMEMIIRDIRLAREREFRRQSEHTGGPRGKNSLSAGTQKSLERKRGVMIQKKAGETRRGVLMRAGNQTGLSADQPRGTKPKQFRANPQRVPENSSSSRPR